MQKPLTQFLPLTMIDGDTRPKPVVAKAIADDLMTDPTTHFAMAKWKAGQGWGVLFVPAANPADFSN